MRIKHVSLYTEVFGRKMRTEKWELIRCNRGLPATGVLPILWCYFSMDFLPLQQTLEAYVRKQMFLLFWQAIRLFFNFAGCPEHYLGELLVEDINAKFEGKAFPTFDMSFADPEFTSGVETPNAGGPTVRDGPVSTKAFGVF